MGSIPKCVFISDDFITKGKKIKNLGEGTYGEVYLYKYDGKSFAVKEMKIDTDKNYEGITRSMVLDTDALVRFRNVPSVIRLDGICFPNKILYLILEEMDGNMEELMKKLLFNKRMEQLDNFILSMLRGISIFETFGINHYDIKPANILYEKINPDNYEFKITDFGLSRAVVSGIAISPKTIFTSWYRPPEFLAAEEISINANLPLRSGDVWSLGIIVLEMINGGINPLSPTIFSNNKYLFLNELHKYYKSGPGILSSLSIFTLKLYDKSITGSFDSKKFLYRTMKDMYFNSIPDKYFKLLDYMLKWNFQERPTANKLLQYLGEKVNSEFIKSMIPPNYPRMIDDSINLIKKSSEELELGPVVTLVAIEIMTRYLGILGNIPGDVVLVSAGCLLISSNYVNDYVIISSDVRYVYKHSHGYNYSADEIVKIERKILMTIKFFVYNSNLSTVIDKLKLAKNKSDDLKKEYKIIDKYPITNFSKPVLEWFN